MCVFQDFVQKALKDGRLQFREKPKSSMNVDSDPIKTEDAHHTELGEIMMVKAVKGSNMEVDKGEQISSIVDSNIQAAYPSLNKG